MNILVIASFAGHADASQILETYGHILEKFRNWQLEHPGEYFSKEDIFTPDVIEALNKIYK